MKKKALQLSIFVLVLLFACKKDENADPVNETYGETTAEFNTDISYGTLTDQEGNIYKTVTIGTQTWMAENLRTTIYNDGSSIPKVADNDEWGSLSTGAYCNYKDTSSTIVIATYGRLYNWYSVNTGKLAPEGWHVPSDAEWNTLIEYLGGTDAAGIKLKETGTSHWDDTNTAATNESGFTALPAGIRGYENNFFSLGHYCFWWSASSTDDDSGMFVQLRYDGDGVNVDNLVGHYGLSVRCVKD